MSEDKLNKLVKKFMLIFLILVVSSAGYCGFFLKWAFREDSPNFGFQAMIENTANKPFIHRQLLPVVVKSAVEIIPQATKEKLSANLIEKKHIEKRFAQSVIPEKYVLEYYLMFIICFLSFFAAIWILRSLLSEILQDEVAGTLGAILFALLFPFFEVMGGYYYDCLEVLFLFLAAKFALRGNFFGLLILAPVATLNKESFFFFLATLYPLTRQKFSCKKSAAITLASMFVSGLAYLFVRQTFINNPGDMADSRIFEHLDAIFDISTYFLTDSIYGMSLPSRMFFLHIIYVVWLVKNYWQKLSDAWKLHAKIALVINGILYWLFVVPGELRDLSMLYLSLMILTSYFLRDIFQKNYAGSD